MYLRARPGMTGRPSALPHVVATVAGALLLLISVPNIGTVLRAARADGVPGTFTGGHATCVTHLGHEACTWYGTFQSADGRERRDTTLYGAGRNALRPGERIAAIDVGRSGRVYRPSGSNEWIVTGLLALAGVAFLIPLGRRTVTAVRSGRQGVAGQDGTRDGKATGRPTRTA
jgi:hypothetical protein